MTGAVVVGGALSVGGCAESAQPDVRPDAIASAAPSASASPRPEVSAAPSATATTATTAAVMHPTGVPGDDIAHGLVVAQCREQTCHGDLARVTILRDERGRAGGVRFDGDLSACSHPPAVYVDHQGATVHTVPLRPVSKEEAARIAEATQRTIAPFREAETITCKRVLDGSWVPEAKGTTPRILPLPFGPGWQHASYSVIGHVFDVQGCEPCPAGKTCEACEETIRVQSHPEDNTAERIALVRTGPHGIAPAAGTAITEGGWYVFLVEPRDDRPPQGWRQPLTMLGARRTTAPPR